ncbi:S9 family peptidase [Pseudoduganella sp. OTU4001]|uniref:S9 family peptidase n=1 Tax=Pseudoduganella sp. OTU4001 TaxID=3043854 RepID=UPI00313B61B8
MAGLLVLAPAFAQVAGAPPVEAFFDNPPTSKPALSPSGKYVAMRVDGSGGHKELAVFELATGKGTPIKGFADASVGEFQWVNDERLVYAAEEDRLGNEGIRYQPGLFAVNRDGSEFKRLAARVQLSQRVLTAEKLLPWNTYMLPQTGRKLDTDYIYAETRMSRGERDIPTVELVRINTRTGRSTTLSGPRNTKRIMLDYDGEPRIAEAAVEDKVEFHYRDPKRGNDWRKLFEHTRYANQPTDITPLAVGPDGTLYVLATGDNGLEAVYRYDLENNKLGAQVIQQKDFDFRGELLFTAKGLAGIRYIGDAESTQWLDADMKAMQDKLDKLLPNTENLVTIPAYASAQNYMVKTYSDAQPPSYWVYDNAANKITKIGDTKPQLNAAALGKRRMVRYQARDGMTIPAFLTLPKNHGKALPMIVLAGDTPFEYGSNLAFDEQAQFFASRGYAVLQPEVRGSKGHGNRHWSAGLKQWGLKRQDDYADGVKWAVSQGFADAKRVCIAGGGRYGGYAALMGLVNDPDVYRCGISWSGIVDFELMANGGALAAKGVDEAWARYGMPVMIGDLARDAERLKRTSPLQQAARIKQPLLLAYGDDDPSVPRQVARKFHEAVKQGNQRVEWVEYPAEEGVKWVNPATRFDFNKRIEKFLDKQIGAGAPN